MRVPLLACALVTLSMACSNEPPSMTATAAVPVVSEGHGASDHGTAAHGDHTPRNGGTVYMKGDLHFEVVLSPTGAHRVYFSDASRAELPASTASEVSLTVSRASAPDEILKAEIDEAGECWIAAGRLITGAGVSARVAFVVSGEPYWIDVPYIEAPDAVSSRGE